MSVCYDLFSLLMYFPAARVGWEVSSITVGGSCYEADNQQSICRCQTVFTAIGYFVLIWMYAGVQGTVRYAGLAECHDCLC